MALSFTNVTDTVLGHTALGTGCKNAVLWSFQKCWHVDWKRPENISCLKELSSVSVQNQAHCFS